LRLAGGRTTDEELRRDARERQAKSRDKRGLSTPVALPKPALSFRDKAHVTETVEPTAEDTAKERKAQNDAADKADGQSDRALREFRVACDLYLAKMNQTDLTTAINHALSYQRRKVA
jgi:hypothetical protein